MPKKILIIDGSDFRRDLIKVVKDYTSSMGIMYDAIPNSKVPVKEIKNFVKDEVNRNTYAMVFCHLRWISEKIEALDGLKDSDWFKLILNIDNRVGVSNGSDFREKAEELNLFKNCYSHREAADMLREVLDEYSKRSRK